MAALWPVPSRTTAVMMVVSSRAVSGEITWRTAFGSKTLASRPCASSTARTICGRMSRAPLAAALPREAQPHGLAEAEAGDVPVVALLAELHARLDRAHVGGVLQHLGEREPAERLPV